jgi:Putative prokaryotic signal transducing protein
MDGGELVGVAHASDRVEAEMIKGLLESSGIPSVLQHVGIDGPGLGIGWLNPGGGSHRVMVRASQSEQARDLLAERLVESEQLDLTEIAQPPYAEETGRKPRDYSLAGAYARIWVWSLGAVALAFAVFLLLRMV